MFEKLISFTKDVSDLSDEPSLSTAALKAQFDAAPDEVRVYLNKLIDALKSTATGDSGAKNIGATAISGLTGSDVQALLESLNTLKANVAQPTTNLQPIANGTADGAGRGIQYWKDTMGYVHVIIDVNLGANYTNPVIIGILPAGYRPAITITDTLAGWNLAVTQNSGADINIATDGTITLGKNLGGICFVHKMFPPFKPQ